MRRLVSAFLGACALVTWGLSVPSSASAAAGVPAPVPLSHGWQFAPDPGDQGVARHWATGGRAPWRTTTVPGVFDARPLKSLFHGTVGWYRVTFAGPRSPGFTWSARFEQVRRTAQVWLNGVPVGRHTDPYVPFATPLHALRPGQPNTLIVRVDNRKGAEPREGWWNWGGITRPVTLVPRGMVTLHDLGLLSQVNCAGPAGCQSAALRFEARVSNRSAIRVQPIVIVRLVAPNSGQVTTSTVQVRSIAPGETAQVRRTIPVPSPELWSPGSPRLYAATVQTSVAGAPQQVDTLDVGLRSVAVVNGKLELNGRVLDLRGASIQEDVAGRGAALTEQDMDHIVSQLIALHANVTRAHYLLNDRLLDRLDRAGILVWSQAPVYHRDKLLETPAQRSAALATLRGTVLIARNHPSVITHSVANELTVTPDIIPGTRMYLDGARRVVHELDPTLPVSVDLLSYPGFPRQQAYARFDMFGVNSYFGWYPGKAAHPTGRLDDLGPYLSRLHELYPRQALLLTEFGAESTMAGPASQKETYAFQSAYLRRVLGIVERKPFMGGAIYWTLREFAVKPDWDGGAKRDVPRDSIHNKGLMTYTGHEKPAWNVAEGDFATTALYRASPALAAAAARSGTPGPFGIVVIALLALALLALIIFNGRAARRILRPRAPEPRRLPLPGPAPAAAPARVVARP